MTKQKLQFNLPPTLSELPADLVEGLGKTDSGKVLEITADIVNKTNAVALEYNLFLGEKFAALHKIYAKRGPKSQWWRWKEVLEVNDKFEERCRDLYTAFGDVDDKKVLTQFTMRALYYLAKRARNDLRGKLLAMAAKDENLRVTEPLAKEFAAHSVGNTLPFITPDAEQSANRKKRLKSFRQKLQLNDSIYGEVIVRHASEDRDHAIRRAIETLQQSLKSESPSDG